MSKAKELHKAIKEAIHEGVLYSRGYDLDFLIELAAEAVDEFDEVNAEISELKKENNY